MKDFQNISTFLIGVSTAFFLILAVYILMIKANRTRFQTVLGGIATVWALSNLKDLILTFPGMYTEHVLNWILVIDGWSAITYTIFIYEVTMPRWTTLRKILLLCIPWTLFTIAYMLYPTQIVLNAYITFLWFYAWSIVIIGFVKIRRYRNYLHKNYSHIENIDASWMLPVFLFSIISQLSWLIASLYANILVDILYYVSTIVLWLIALYYSWNFQPIIIKEDSLQTLQQRYIVDEEKLEDVMNVKRIYLNQDLTLNDLARSIGTNRTYMSNYLSQVLGLNFYDYINKKRIEHSAIPMMKEHPEFTLEHVAQESGFGSISTFRRAYIKYVGQPPSRLKKMN